MCATLWAGQCDPPRKEPMNQPDVVIPCIHLNGDRKATLVGNLEAAYDAVRAAEEALRECSPNARNYYPDPGRMELALTQHRARQEHLHAVLASLEAEVIGIQDAYPTPR